MNAVIKFPIPQTRPRDIVSGALSFAQSLDMLLAATQDDTLHEALTIDIGELLGGLSRAGFRGDLERAICNAEETLYSEHRGNGWSPGRGGTDPDAFVSAWLDRELSAASVRICLDWQRDASAVLAEFQ